MADFAQRRHIVRYMTALMEELAIAKPADPVEFLISTVRNLPLSSLVSVDAGAQKAEVARALDTSPLFAHIDTAAISATMRKVTFPRGTSLVNKGELGDYVFVITNGDAVVEPSGVILGRNDVVGDLAVLFATPQPNTVTARTEVTAMSLAAPQIRRKALDTISVLRAKYLRFIERIPLFAELSTHEQFSLVSNLRSAVFSAGDAIVTQGEFGDTFYLVTQGEVAIWRQVDPSVPASEVARIGEGSFFGEVALLTSCARAATVKALGKVVVLCIDQATFQSVLGNLQDFLERHMDDYQQFVARQKRDGQKSVASLPELLQMYREKREAGLLDT